jgi:NADH-quinone oxidoreductase subunit L
MNPYSDLIPFIVAIPLLGFLINGLVGLKSESYRKHKALIGGLSTLAVFIPFIIAVLLFINMSSDSEPIVVHLFTWIKAGHFSTDIAYRIDPLSIVMVMVVTGVGSLIHLYSMGYMSDDRGYWKFFAYLNLFIFAMLNLVMGSNVLLLFLGWEGVGLCSYLLIGFWYEDMDKAIAAKKAFLYNRVGDFAFLIAMFMLYQTVGSLDFGVIIKNVHNIPHNYAFWITLLMLVGATGKSAQIPLFVWLPDAMAGPTPVSALIHAATMVTSGIYLISRLSFLYALVPSVMLVVAVIGGVTALVAATIAITQQDIKRVLAYSTVSQLGYMFLALGAGGYAAAMFHLVTHAFFKGLLFLGAGSVITSMHRVEHKLEHEGKHVHFDPQDMRNMGGLKKYMPSTYWTFMLATLAISGIPIFAGFFSKDEVLAFAFNAGLGQYAQGMYFAVWGIGMITAFLTGFYMFRLTIGTFHGTFKLPKRVKGAENAEQYLEENGWNMTVPLWILGILSAIGGFIGLPEFWAETFGSEAHINAIHNWLENVTATVSAHASMGTEWILMLISIILAVGAAIIAYKMYSDDKVEASDAMLAKRFGGLYQLWADKYNFDEAYEGYVVNPVVKFSDRVLAVFDMKVVDGIVNAVGGIIRLFGSIFRYIQTGVTQNYALIMVLGVIIVLGILIL